MLPSPSDQPVDAPRLSERRWPGWGRVAAGGLRVPRWLSISLSGLLLGLALVLGFSLQGSEAACVPPNNPGDPYSCSARYALVTDPPSVYAGGTLKARTSNVAISRSSAPVAGTLLYPDYVALEIQARSLLSPTLQFRKDISPHLGKPDFDRLVRSFDYNSGFSKPITTTSSLTPMTIADRLADADVKLRRARNIYAYLAVYAPGDRFHAETAVQYPAYHADLCKAPDDVVADTVDWCDFAGRMRQSVREVAYLHMIFGQQFTTDALGLHFSADLIGGEEFVRDEVRKLDSAVTEFGSAEKVVIEGLNIPLGSGCSVSDFYSQSEWALLSRAVEGKEVAQHQVAIRKSYLDDNGPTVAQNTYQTAAGDQYVKLIGTAGLTVTQPRFSGCARGTRPDSDMVAKMVSDMVDTRQSAEQLREGRNVFGFDVHFTPARPYRTASGSNDTGIWDEAIAAARQAKEWQNDDVAASRQFDENQIQLQNAISGVKDKYDARLLTLTGCSRNQFGNDDDYFACVFRTPQTLKTCTISAEQAAYDACVNNVRSGLLRQNWDNMRTAYLRMQKVQKQIENIPNKIDSETLRNTTINSTLYANGKDQEITQYLLAFASSQSCSAGFPAGVSCSLNPLWPVVGALQHEQTMREIGKEAKINNANSEATIRNLLLEAAELDADRSVANQEFNAQVVQFLTLDAENENLWIEARRARAYLQSSPYNDPSYRLVRDSARLRLGTQLDYAARVAYMAAKRAEYEYAARLSASNFRISDIYRARTADDITNFLNRLKGVTDNLIVSDAEVQQEDFKLSVALHLLGLTDQSLGLTGDPARAERARRFHQWVTQNTTTGSDGKPVLAFNFTTSVVTNSIFSNVILQGYDRFWLHEMAGIGTPKAANTGFTINLVSAQAANLRYRRVVVSEGGLLHLRARSGCILEYRLIQPAALLGLEWPSNQPAQSVTTDFKANINNAGGERTPAFLARPVSATDWQVTVFAGAPEGGLADMDLQQLSDIELNFSTTRGSRAPGEPPPQACVRVDF